jgi:hypothetical protein
VSAIDIQKMIENGFAIKRIATKTNVTFKEIDDLIILNKWQIIKEFFDDSKIDHICSLYAEGVSAKALAYKFSIDKRRVQKWVKFKSLLRDKSSSHRFTKFNQHIFDTIDTNEKAYWLGFFYADAYNSETVNTFCLTLKGEDYSHLIKLCKFIELPESKISTYLSYIGKKSYPTCSVRLYSKHICEKMTELGCPRAKSFIIKYPEWLSDDLAISFIRGMFDGDGSLCKRQSGEWKWSIATTKECGESIQKIIFDKLQLIVNLSFISKTNHNTYELESNGNEKVLKLSKWLYENAPKSIRLDRKYQKYLDLIDFQDNRSFKKNEYKVSEENKKSIIDELIGGINIKDISIKYKLHQRTITKMKHDDAFLYDKIVSVNNNLITAKYVKTLDHNQRQILIDPLFDHFRNQGWLYPDNDSKLKSNWKKLCNFEPDLSKDELFNNSSMATDICKYFCHKFYDATENNQPTMKEVFSNDSKLKKLIQNRLGMDWKDEENDETFNMSFRMLIQGMRSSRVVPSISIFKPNIAKYLYMKYTDKGDTVYDYSAGWGGRMLGAASCDRKYIGTDPLTTDELSKISDFLSLKNITLINNGSENVKLDENSIDFSFSSPPYFDQEVYSADKSQAYNNGDDHFYDTYWAKTLDNVKYMLKPNKYFGLNILEKYTKMIDMAKEQFGEPCEIVKLRTIRNHLTKSSGIEKFEPVYIFKNIK